MKYDILNSNKKIKKNEITQTTFRTYNVLKILLNGPISKEKLIATYNKIVAPDKLNSYTIPIVINNLKELGCEITIPTPANQYKYIISSHPFLIDITAEQIDMLINLREIAIFQGDYDFIFSINKLFQKILSIAKNKPYFEKLQSTNIFKNIDEKLVKDLVKYCEEKKTIVMEYISTSLEKKEVTVTLDKISFENNRLYLWGYSHKYRNMGYFRIDRIKGIQKVLPEKFDIKSEILTVKYRLKRNILKNFILMDNEIIEEKSEKYVVISAKVINKFNFFQRIALFTNFCVILEPENIKREYLNFLDEILMRYENE